MLERLQRGLEAWIEALLRQEFVHVQHGAGEGIGSVAQDFAIGLEGVTTAGGCDQHCIERFCAAGDLEALHQIRRQLLGLLHLPLVMAGGSAAALLFGNHHLKAVGLQHRHRCGIHRRVKTALHTAEHQPHPAAARTDRWVYRSEAIGETFRCQRRQQGFHRLQLGAEKFESTAAAGQLLQWCAGVGTQGGEQGTQSPGIGQHRQQQLAEAGLPGSAQFGLIETGSGGFDQLVVTHAGGAGAHAGKAAQAAVEMPRHRGVHLQLTGCDGLEGVDAAAGGIHLRAQHAVAGAGGQAEAAVHAGVCDPFRQAGERGGCGLGAAGLAHQQSLTPDPLLRLVYQRFCC